MVSKNVIITNKSGLHVRPASVLVKTASKFKAEITICVRDKEYSASSVLGILSSGVKMGDEVTVRAAGEEEVAALEAVVSAIESGLGEK